MSKPLFIELAGLPGSGKSTTALLLYKEITRHNLKCVLLPEAASISPLQDFKGKYPFTLWTILYYMTRILECESSNEYDIVILDRGLFDSLCWFTWLKNSGEIDSEIFEITKSFVEKIPLMTEPHLVLVLQAKFRTALLRREGDVGRIVNQIIYAQIEESYEYMLHQSFPRSLRNGFHIINTDYLSPKQVCDWALDRIDNTWPFLLKRKAAQ